MTGDKRIGEPPRQHEGESNSAFMSRVSEWVSDRPSRESRKLRRGTVLEVTPIPEPKSWIPFHWILAIVTFGVGVGGAYVVLVNKRDNARVQAISAMQEAEEASESQAREIQRLELQVGELRRVADTLQFELDRSRAAREEVAAIDQSILDDIGFLIRHKEAIEKDLDLAGNIFYMARLLDESPMPDQQFVTEVAEQMKEWVARWRARLSASEPNSGNRDTGGS